MMMGAGILFMLLFGLLLIGIPILIVALIAGGGLRSFLERISPPPQVHTPSTAITPRAEHSLSCPACGSGVQSDWRNCPHCGTRLT